MGRGTGELERGGAGIRYRTGLPALLSNSPLLSLFISLIKLLSLQQQRKVPRDDN